MIEFRILTHTPGRIKIRIPALQKASLRTLQEDLKLLSQIELPPGIERVKANPFSRDITIFYDPAVIDVMDFLETMASHPILLGLHQRRTTEHGM